jgi:hypothetical protein
MVLAQKHQSIKIEIEPCESAPLASASAKSRRGPRATSGSGAAAATVQTSGRTGASGSERMIKKC